MKACTRFVLCIGGSLVLGLSGLAQAEDATVSRAEVEALKTEIAQLKSQQSQTWLNERRAEEVKSLIKEVLSDAETRASLLQDGMSAGHNGSHFFLQSADGGFLMEIDGQIQVRYAASFRSDSPGDDSSPSDGQNNDIDDQEAGFEIPRTQLRFSGHIADPRIKYAVQLSVDKSDNSVSASQIIIGYQLTDSLFVWAGEDNAPFLRSDVYDDFGRYELAVDRPYINEFFRVGVAQGIGLKWYDPAILNDMLKASVMVNDGAYSGEGSTSVNPFTQLSDFDAQQSGDDRSTSKLFDEDATDFAFSGRLDVRITGGWAQMQDFSSAPGEDFAAFVGGALHYEVGETGDLLLNNNFFAWTVDGSIESNGFSAFAAVMGMHTDNESSAAFATKDYDLLGFTIQGAYNFAMGDNSLEPFVRYEFIDLDDAVTATGANTEDEINILTFGANYYLQKHNAKVTFDIVWALDPVPFYSTTQNLLADSFDEDGQVVLRTQFQLLF